MAEERLLITGNEAAAEAAIRAGCRHYYGYPITPQNELTAYMAANMPEAGGVFIQAESELAAISMVFGTAAAGKRVMTSSSSPGISLKQEGLSYLAGAELPCVVINVMRAGPGLGTIFPAQSDYFQATRGGGHGDYRLIVLAPHTVQETIDLVQDAFDLADLYRTPVLILTDGQVGQMMEPAVFRERPERELPPKDWVLTGAKGREKRVVCSFHLSKDDIIEHNRHLQEKFSRIQENEVRYEARVVEDADVVFVAYGTAARVCLQAMRDAPAGGPKLGLLRPITLWPFPTEPIRRLAEQGKAFVAVEMSAGQMIEDVRLAVEGRGPVGFCGSVGCGAPGTAGILQSAADILAPGES